MVTLERDTPASRASRYWTRPLKLVRNPQLRAYEGVSFTKRRQHDDEQSARSGPDAYGPSHATDSAPETNLMTASDVGTRTRVGVLVVDDESSIVVAVQRVLKRDHDVVAETSSRRALARIKNGERFDVIIADLIMPDLSGAELYAEIRKLDPKQAERVLFLTGAAFTPAGRDFLASVPNRWIGKPFEVEGLRREVADALRL
jgi:CheY-like chemotaxis protein